MAWITTVSDEQAAGECAEVFDSIRSNPAFAGNVPNGLRALSLRPEVMGALWGLMNKTMLGGTGLTQQEEEMIITVVSSINRSHY